MDQNTNLSKDVATAKELRVKMDQWDRVAEVRDLSTPEKEAFVSTRRQFFNAEKIISQSLKQNSRVRSARAGDENTSFFHGIVRGGLKRNTIKGLNVNGCWVEDPSTLKNHIADFFMKHFQEHDPLRPSSISQKFRKLTTDQASLLEAPFTEDEIKHAVWSCGGSKAPGPDGYSFSFIKSNWELLKSDIMATAMEFQKRGKLAKGCNSTFLSLIPKSTDPLTLNDYRPIS